MVGQYESATSQLSTDAEQKLSRTFDEMKPECDRLYREKYPNKADWSPNSHLSKKFCSLIQQCKEDSKQVRDLRTDEWQEMEGCCYAFAQRGDIEHDLFHILSDAEGTAYRDQHRGWDDSRSHKGEGPKRPLKVVLPETLAAQIFYCSQQLRIFGQRPIHQFVGLGGPESISGSAKATMAISQINRWFDEIIAMNNAFKYGAMYGTGDLFMRWGKRKVWNRQRDAISEILEPFLRESGIVPKAEVGHFIRYFQQDIFQQGPENVIIDPWHHYPDPSVAAERIQESQYDMYERETNAMIMLDEEFDDEDLFNGWYARVSAHRDGCMSRYWDTDSSYRQSRSGISADNSPSNPNVRDRVITTAGFVRIIANEWEVGNNTYADDCPQWWEFELAGDNIVTKLKPLDLDTGMIPINRSCPVNGDSPLPASYLSQTLGEQRYIDFMFNTDMQVVAKNACGDWFLNDRFIDVDSFNTKGLAKSILPTQLGMTAIGTSVKLQDVLHQMEYRGVTDGNIKRIMDMIGFMRHTLGQTDPSRGDLSGMPDKMGSQGAALAMNQANSQMQYYALLNGQKFMYHMGLMEWYMCRQFMEDEMLVRIQGGSRYSDFLKATYPTGNMTVSKNDFDAAFDCDVRDGSQPDVKNPAPLAQVLTSYLGGEGMIDKVVASRGGVEFIDRIENAIMDMYGVKEWPALLGGGGVQTQVLPDQQVKDMQQSGNLVDFGQAAQMMRNGQ